MKPSRATAIVLAASCWLAPASARRRARPAASGASYGGDTGHTRYAPLDQINAANFKDLDVAWRFKTDNLGPAPEFNLQSTPLVVGGRLFSTGGTRRSVVSLDATTGQILWVHNENEDAQRARIAPRQLSGRGLSYWTDGKEERILYVTPGYQLVALDADHRPARARLRPRRHRGPEAGLRPEVRRQRGARRACTPRRPWPATW